LLAALACGAPAGVAAQGPVVTPDSARALLARYRDPMMAVHDGYFSTIACVESPEGAMGVHFINPQAIGPTVDPSKPQVLMYEPVGDSLRLAGAEWFVPLATGITEAPVLFGETFDGPMDGHHPVMPHELRHYDLHVWLFRDNPRGMFTAVNAAISCAGQAYRVMGELEPTVRHR
jgi:hypothetical protein